MAVGVDPFRVVLAFRGKNHPESGVICSRTITAAAEEEHDVFMSTTDDLIPVFIPPLAACLAQAEKLKGSALTEAEALTIRDGAICMMMAADDAAKMAASRGYRDVVPENCWADWHRLRVELTGQGGLPKIVLCLPGDSNFEARAWPLLEAKGIEHEWSDGDARMPAAFQASACRWDPSLTDRDVADIACHQRVLYLLSPNFPADDGPAFSRDFLKLSCQLLEAGALAMKCESSGIAHGRDRWIELARGADGPDPWSALLRAYVQFPIHSAGDFYTCGMHLLGQPDLIVSGSLLRDGEESAGDPGWKAVNLFGVFAHYLLAECEPGQIASGHTFSTDAESPRFRIVWEACTGYDEDDLFFNPFGRWRFAEMAG